MLAAFAAAAAILFQPFVIRVAVLTGDGEVSWVASSSHFSTRAKCEAARAKEIGALFLRGYVVMTDDGPARALGSMCRAEGIET